MDRLEEYARKENVPIIQKEGLDFLINFIKENKVFSILEIGTAIGYSAINMALVDKNIKIVTIERDPNMYKEAVKNVERFNLNKQITLINGDALTTNIEGEYDLIFIDGAKAQYQKFFEKYQSNLSSNGFIICDNLNFHGLTENPETITSKNLRALVKKINNFKEYLKNNRDYKTTFYNLGDGISVSKKKQ